MRLLLILFLLAVLSSISFAADQEPSSSSSSEAQVSPPSLILSDSDSGLPSRTNSSQSSERDARWNRKPSWQIPLNSAGDVCYTMRTYKVKATERLSKNEKGTRGYSTCLFARDYELRSADIRGDRSETTSRWK